MVNFEIIPGSEDSAVVLHVPHSSRYIPQDVRSDILLSDDELNVELDEITDTLTDQIALTAVSKLPPGTPKPWLFINRFSRLVIDPERFPDEREIMNKVGMGAVYTKSTTGAQLRNPDFDNQKLLNDYFHPYALTFTELIKERLTSLGKAVIIDVHSYRAKQHQNAVNHGQKRPAMCIGTDSFHTPDWLITEFKKEFEALGDCFENEPYAGTYVPLDFYGRDKKVASVMMETRADTFLNADLQPHNGFERIAGALQKIICAVQDSG